MVQLAQPQLAQPQLTGFLQDLGRFYIIVFCQFSWAYLFSTNLSSKIL